MFRKLTLFGALLALVVTLFGAYISQSNAGVACQAWPECYSKIYIGYSHPFQSHAEDLFPEHKGWEVELGKYLLLTLGGLALIMLPLAWLQKQQRRVAVGLTTAVLLVLLMQGFLAYAIYMHVQIYVVPINVTAHLLLGFTCFWIFSWLYLATQPAVKARPENIGPDGLTLFAILVLFLEIGLGGWVSSNFAALECADFPRCGGKWLPEADFASALNFSHGMLSNDSPFLEAGGRIAAQWLHRVGALLAFIVLSLVMLKATNENYPKQIRRSGVILSGLLLVQIGLGILAVKKSLPLWAALSHNFLAVLLMLPLLVIYFYSKYTVAEELEFEQVAEAEVKPVVFEIPAEPESLFLRLRSQLQKTRGSLGGVLSSLSFGQKSKQDLLEDLEARLLMADIGMETTTEIIRQLTASLERDQLKDGETLSQALKENLFQMLEPCSQPLEIPKQDGPFVILVVGVNGAGKTTSIGKLAHRLQAQGHSVMLAAGDTFRAAAVEQLQTWGERNNVQVVAQHSGADSASVIFDALQSAKAKGIDVLIADTAGRLHTKYNLMDELKKIKRIMGKFDESAPHEVLLILDAGTGQNALSQARLFNEAVNLTGLALTKLDGTAKGGVIFALANQLRVPIRFIGIGEGIADLQDFDARSFVDALFVKD